MKPRSRLASRVRTALPGPAVEGIAAVRARRQQRARERKLPTATSDFATAYASYWEDGVVPPDAEELLFLATWGSGGTFPRSQSRIMGRPFDPAAYRDLPDELLGDLDPVAVASCVEREGYYVVPFRLDGDLVDDILAVLDAGPAQPRGDGLGARVPGTPDPTAPTWWMDPSQTVRSETARRLLRERRLAEVGGRYLGVDPLIMSVVLWKSFAWGRPDRNSAQQFHYDNDRASFVKMFVYLTDVDDRNGPHTYVPRSHREKPTELLHGRRLSDGDVSRFYPPDGWVTITGEKGTVFFADTQGFHKGGRVSTGERAMFQVNLASDRFGVPEPPIGAPADAPHDLVPAVSAAPRFFSQLFAPERSQP